MARRPRKVSRRKAQGSGFKGSDSGIDLNPPPLGLLLPEDDSFFWEGKGLRSCLGLVLASSRAFFSSKSNSLASNLQLRFFWAWPAADKLFIWRNVKMASLA